MKRIMVFAGILYMMIFSGCASQDTAFAVVDNFEKEKYLGTWYEIARMDFKFEKDLNNTTANYSLQDNRIRVVNRGYNYKTEKWQEAVGKAKFKSGPDKGALLVSFFGPFYGEYNILALDKEYTYALVAGKNTQYLWILSRSRDIPPSIQKKYLGIADELGFNTEELIWVEHDK